MSKKILIGFVVIFVLWNALDFLIHGVLLSGTYSTPEVMRLFRTDMQAKMWIFYLVSVFTAFFFTLIFSKWYKGKGVFEGIQFGVYAGFLMATPMAYSSYAMYPIPYHLAMQWFIYGMLEYVIFGIALSLVFGKNPVAGEKA
jgi:hypothetical protein